MQVMTELTLRQYLFAAQARQLLRKERPLDAAQQVGLHGAGMGPAWASMGPAWACMVLHGPARGQHIGCAWGLYGASAWGLLGVCALCGRAHRQQAHMRHACKLQFL